MRKSSLTSSVFITGIFFLFAGILMLHHELWRDEMQAWLLARDSTSFSNLFCNMRYEGTPPLWHVLLRLLTFISHDPRMMQGLSLLIGTTLVFVINQYAPFTGLQKIMLSFGYFILYQYTVIARNYGLGLLLLAAACVLYEERRSRAMMLSLLLGAAGLTSVHALCVACAIATTWFLDEKSKTPFIPMFIFVACTVLSALCMWPARDALFPPAVGWVFRINSARFRDVMTALTHSFIPIPTRTSHFWETFIVNVWPIGPALITGCLYLVRRNRRTFWMIISGTIFLMAFFYLKHVGVLRHHGFLFFNLLFALWMGRDESVSPVLTGILALQILTTVLILPFEIKYPFSNAKSVAQSISRDRPSPCFIACTADYVGATVAGYLDEPFYFSQGDRWGTFTRWDMKRIEILSGEESLARIKKMAKALGQNARIVTSGPLPNSPGLKLCREFKGAILPDEDYFLYDLIVVANPTGTLDTGRR